MSSRNPSWAREREESVASNRCLLSLGFDVTCWDCARILTCLLWTTVAILTAYLLPMLGAVQSAMPSFMCACLVLMFHRQRVRLCGLSRETADAYVGAYRFLSALGCLVYLVFLMATIFVFQLDCAEDPAYFFMTSTWLLVALLWFVMQACLKPSPKQIDDMVRLYEHSHPGGTLSPAPPSADQGPHVGALVATIAPAAAGAAVGRKPREAAGKGAHRTGAPCLLYKLAGRKRPSWLNGRGPPYTLYHQQKEQLLLLSPHRRSRSRGKVRERFVAPQLYPPLEREREGPTPPWGGSLTGVLASSVEGAGKYSTAGE
ncbi:hypothetical protein cyc_07294 [Cyclospora cayetanensis]|uniref:Transmembrane protein n=1 Tax=Cyclospora cayetanensis TaxID=88456 RepID=A0A1D3CW38_9EIME|nr:hypothetical protein cyc_07294 [Cyclospora cayetanensis]